MAARKQRRGHRRGRGRFGFLYQLLSVAAILAALVLGSAVFFRVDGIIVTGQSRYTAEEIIAAAEIKQGDNLFALDKVKLSRQILTRLPYVSAVSLRRRLPDKLELTVTESTAAAAVEENGAWWLLSAGGKYLERADAQGGLPAILGLTPTSPAVGTKLAVDKDQSLKLDCLRKLLAALDARGMTGQVGGYDLTAANVVLVEYGGRFTLKLPLSGTDYKKETLALQETLKRLPENSSGTLDFTLSEDIHLIPYS